VRYQDVLYEVGALLARKGAAARASQRDPLGTYLQRKAEAASAKPLRTLRWLERWTPRGVWALLWRDLLITWRASGWGNLLMVALMAAVPVGLALLIHYTAPPERDVRLALKIAYAVAQAMTAFFISFGAFYGFTDMLRRVEWQKPLPFSPRAVMVVESLPSVVFFAGSQLLAASVISLWFPSALAVLAGQQCGSDQLGNRADDGDARDCAHQSRPDRLHTAAAVGRADGARAVVFGRARRGDLAAWASGCSGTCG
jgi:hypothetical protein